MMSLLESRFWAIFAALKNSKLILLVFVINMLVQLSVDAQRPDLNFLNGEQQQNDKSYMMPNKKLGFEKNMGQIEEANVLYKASAAQATYFFEKSEIRSVISNKNNEQVGYSMAFLNSNENVSVEGIGFLPTKITYHKNNESYPNITYNRQLIYTDLWQGIDAKFYEKEKSLKYDFIVRPHTKPDVIQFQMKGVKNLEILEDGTLQFETHLGKLQKGKPFSYQEIDGKKVEIKSAYKLNGDIVSFELGEYDITRTLIIDPVALLWSTFLGDGATYFTDMYVHPTTKNIYLAGRTQNVSYPISFNGVEVGDSTADGFVSCLSADGTTILWSAYIGGTDYDQINAVYVNNAGDVFLSGETASPDFPINGTVSAYDNSHNGSHDVVIMRLNNDGSVVKYSTFIGTVDDDRDKNRSIIVDNDKVYSSAYIQNNTTFPSTLNAYQTTAPSDGAAIFCINTAISGNAGLVYSTFLTPQTNNEGYTRITDMETDVMGNIYIMAVGGYRFPPTTPNAVQTAATLDAVNSLDNNSDVCYVAKLDPTLSNLLYGSVVAPIMSNVPNQDFNCQYHPQIAVNEDGDIYCMSGWTFLGISNSQTDLTPASNIQQLNIMNPYYVSVIDGGLVVSNIICKIPAFNPSQYEFVNVFSGNFYHDWEAGAEIDNRGRVHYFYSVNYNQDPFSGEIQGVTTTQDALQTSLSEGDASIMYTILSSSGAVAYSTVLGVDLSSRFAYVTPYTAFVTDDCKAYIAGYYDNDAFRYPVTPTYHDFETGTQKAVYDATPSPSGGGFVTVFHEPTLMNTIDDFTIGNNTFCVGGLIYQNPNDGPINGQAVGYISGNGSSPTHTLPDISRNGAIFPHPNPATAVQYQWEKSYDGTTWLPIFGGDLEVLKPEPELSAGTVQYRRAIQNSCDTIYSNIATATIAGDFNLNINAPTTPVYYCEGSTTNLGITVTGASGNISWQWYDGFAPLSNSVITPSSGSGTAASFSANIATSATSTGYYRLVVTDASGCKREAFVTIVPLTESAGSGPIVAMCPTTSGGSVTLGPSAVNPNFDYQWTGPSGFTSNLPNPVVNVAGDYFLSVKLKTQSTYCAGGQTQVNVSSFQAFAPELTTLSDVGFCQDESPAIIGNGLTAPAGYVFQWTPGVNLDDVTLFNPSFDPGVLPFGITPISSIEYTFSALRLSDGCIFETTMTVTDTARAFADAGIDKPACDLNPSQNFGAPEMTGTYFQWRPVATTYPGGISTLTSSGQWTMDGSNTSVSYNKFLTATFPNYTSAYTIDFEVIASYTTYPNGCNTRDTVRLFYKPDCGDDWCEPLRAKLSGTDGACSGATSWIEGVNLAGLSSTWTTYSVDGVVQPPNTAPQGLFEDNNGVKGNQLVGGATHPSRVIVDFDDPTWGWSGANVVVYRLTSTGNFGGGLIDCHKDIQVFSATNAAPVVGVLDNSICTFPSPGTRFGTNGQVGPYIVTGSDYTTAPNSSLIWEWTQTNSNFTPDITGNGNTPFPTLDPTKTTDFLVKVQDPATGCVAYDTMTINLLEVVANAGIDKTDVCENSLIQLGTAARPNHTYSWTPTSGLNDPIGTPNANSAQPYLIAPNVPTGIEYALLVTETTIGCQATDTVTISTTTDAPPTPTPASYSRCGGTTFTIGNNVTGNGLTFSWSAGAGADITWLNSTSINQPTVTLPSNFSGSAVFTLTVSKGNCGTTSAIYTINDNAIAINLASPQTANCTAPLLQIGVPSTSGYTYAWFPYDGLYLDVNGTIPYNGLNRSQVYALPSITTTYNLVASTTSGCFATDNITVNPPAGVLADAGSDKNWCPNSAAISIGSSATGTTTWSAVGYTSNVNGTPSTPTAAQATTMMSYLSSSSSVPTNFSQTTIASGKYVYRLTATNGGCTVSDEVTIIVPNIVTDLVGTPQSVCLGESVKIGSSIAPINYSYSWSAISPSTANNTISDRFTARTIVTPITTTTYQLTYTDLSSGCTYKETVVVSMTPKPNIADVSTTPLCAPVGSQNLTTNIPSYSSYSNPIWYAYAPNGGALISNPTAVTVPTTTNYYLIAQNDFGCRDTAQVTVNIENPQTPVIPSNATTDCTIKTIDLMSLVSTPSNSTYTFEWHNANNTSAASLITNTIVSAGTYYVFEKSPIGCYSNSDMVVVADDPNCIDPCDPVASGNTDTDGDGVADICDLDDDNDGILDIEECTTNPVTISNIATGTVPIGQLDPYWDVEWISVLGDNNFAVGSNIVQDAIVIGELIGAWADPVPGANWISYDFSDITTNGPGNHEDADGDGIANEGTVNPISGATGDYVRLRFFNDNINIPVACDPNAISLNLSIAHDNSIIDVLVNGVSNGPSSSTGFANASSITLNKGWQVGTNTIEVILNSSPHLVGFFLTEGTINCRTCNDTDGDGIPDYLDTDSDDDGCPDAIEGTANFTNTDLINDRLTGGIDANGVPTVANGGQGAGGSYDANITLGCDEICGDGQDNDSDGLIDCADSDCQPIISNISVTQPTCTSKTGGQIIITATGSGVLSYSIANEPNWQSSNTFSNLGIGQHTIRVRNDSGCETEYVSNPIVLDFTTCVEICDNGIDDDGDGKIDCEDSDCKSVGTMNTINN